MGGAVAQQVALDAPERIASLTLIDTTAGYDDADAKVFRQRATQARERGMKALADGTLERWLGERFRKRHPEASERVRALVAKAHPEGFAAACEALAAFDVRAKLSEIDAPTLVLVGENDPPRRRPSRDASPAASPVPGWKSCPTPPICRSSSRNSS